MDINYSYAFIEKYGHGKNELNDVPDNKKVKIADDDGHFFVYEADDNQEALDIAKWFVDVASAESNCSTYVLLKEHDRYFFLEEASESCFIEDDAETGDCHFDYSQHEGAIA